MGTRIKMSALARMKGGGGVGVAQEASQLSVIKDDRVKANPWVDPSEGPEAAAFRFMTQVEGYFANKQNWAEVNYYLKLLSRGLAPGSRDPTDSSSRGKPRKVGVSKAQLELMDKMRQSVGLPVHIKLKLCGLSTLLVGLVALLVFLWFATIDLQEQIDEFKVVPTYEVLEPPSSLDLRLERLTVPFGPTSTVCRSFKVNYTSDAQIVGFQARSVGYPFGASNPADKVVRTMSLWLADFDINATNDAGDGSNFFCQQDAPAGAAGRLLWHWSRSAGTDTRYMLPKEVGLLLPGVSQLLLQVDYDVETGSRDLRQLTSLEFWNEFKPFDESGIALELASSAKLRPELATLLQVGTLDLLVPKLASSTHSYTCHFSADSPNFRHGASLTVIAGSTRTRGAGTNVVLEVVRPIRVVENEEDDAPPPPPPSPPLVVWSSITGGNANLAVPGAGSDAPALQAHAALLPQFSELLPTGQPAADDVELRPLKLEQGDMLRIQCSYSTRYSLTVDAPGGWGRGHELCAAFLYVYPATDVLHGVCGSYAKETVSFDGHNCTT